MLVCVLGHGNTGIGIGNGILSVGDRQVTFYLFFIFFIFYGCRAGGVGGSGNVIV